jgi:hypothetical protein
MEPPQSVPIPTAARLAAIAAPLPALDPPGSRPRSNGFLVSSLSEEKENQEVVKSGSVVLPRITAPASRSLRTVTASCSGV